MRSTFCCKIVFLLLVVCLEFSLAQAQKVKCDVRNISIREFKADSLYTFNNAYVAAGGLPNIKLSKNPVELRMYMINAFFNVVDVITIVGNDHYLEVNKKRIYISGARRKSKDDVIKKGQMEANIQLQSSRVEYQCSLIDSLAKNGFFTEHSSNRSEYKRSNRNFINDEGLLLLFDIKVGSQIRNFQYSLGSNFDDIFPERQKRMQAIFDTFIKIAGNKAN